MKLSSACPGPFAGALSTTVVAALTIDGRASITQGGGGAEEAHRWRLPGRKGGRLGDRARLAGLARLDRLRSRRDSRDAGQDQAGEGGLDAGLIVVKGAVVTREYYARPKATALAKILEPGGAHWHRMGDVGYFDDRGRLWFCGRKSQRVLTETGTLFTVACERIFNQHPDISRTALVGVPGDAPGVQIPVLCVELVHGKNPSEAMTREILAIGKANPMTTSITRILYHPDFPVDTRHNAKIQREQLAVWASKRIS